MNYYVVELEPNVFQRITNDVVQNDVRHPFANLDVYTDEELAALGVYRVVMAVVPSTQRITESQFVWVDGVVTQQVVTQDVPPTVPQQVSAAQAKIALLGAGLLETVTDVITGRGTLSAENIWFTNASVWDRMDPYVVALGTQLGLTAKQIDDLFIAASKV